MTSRYERNGSRRIPRSAERRLHDHARRSLPRAAAAPGEERMRIRAPRLIALGPERERDAVALLAELLRAARADE